jgi:hypothetical protein
MEAGAMPLVGLTVDGEMEQEVGEIGLMEDGRMEGQGQELDGRMEDRKLGLLDGAIALVIKTHGLIAVFQKEL